MTFLDPRFWLALALALAAAYGGGRWHQYKSDQKDIAASALAQSEAARLRERSMQVSQQRIQDDKDAALRAAGVERDAALRRLRDRPSRLPEPALAACAGATGRELSRPDSEFLLGLAERAERYRLLLDACQKREAVAPESFPQR